MRGRLKNQAGMGHVAAGGSSLRVCLVGLAVAVVCMAAAGPVFAGVSSPAWSIHSFAAPTSFSVADNARCEAGGGPEGCDVYEVIVRNVGSAASDGSTVVLTDALPAGVTVREVQFYWTGLPFGEPYAVNLGAFGFCSTAPVRCELPTGERGWPPVTPDDGLRMIVAVTVNPGASGVLRNAVTVSGGGAAEVAGSSQGPVDVTLPFGASALVPSITGIDGGSETQAGAHPYEFSTRLDLNNNFRTTSETGVAATSVEDPRNVVVDLPLGFLGSALAAPQCTFDQLTAGVGGTSSTVSGCPPDSRVGTITVPTGGTNIDGTGLYNMVPEHGVVAELGFADVLKNTHVLYSSVVPTPAGYVLRSTSPLTPQISFKNVEVTLFGNPAAKDGTGSAPVAFFTNPSDCSGNPLVTSIHTDSWQHPGSLKADGSPDLGDPNWVTANGETPPVTGCDQLRFEPSLTAQPETTVADAPTGVNVAVHVPQNEEPGVLATPPLRDASVKLPAGLTLNPAAASGLGACSEAQIGLGSALTPSCPESSKIGTVEVESPLTPGVLQGDVYLATQNQNPFHTLLAGYIVIDDPTTGIIIKIPGNLTPDQATGQITGVFDENPQFPFSALRLHFFGGARGELATPSGCGTYTTTSDLMPWSAPDSGPDATPSDSFQVLSGCGNAFSPGFTAGNENPQAGGYSPFVLSISRNDGEQNLAGASVTLPEGALGKIAGIPLCPDANATAGTCPEASRVGSVTAGAGSGPNPFFVSGQAYLTGPYNGGPYGLVEEIPAVAGPFNLGTVVVRQSLRIDPHTAQVTAVSDPLPTILQGIPLRVRRVDVTLDRPNFTFNPTSCTPMAVTGSITSTQGATANVSSRFQVGGCKELPFKPTFTVSTQAKTSKKNGASLDVKVTLSQGQANIGKVAVTLPKALPSRLTTIQQACPEATFNANPASCPTGSNIGIATAHTPVLAGPVVGPAYLVSHGGAAFPDLVLILQGEGVKLELTGSINIKKSVTSSAFNAVPDAPISSFELKLPEGPHSGLAAVLPPKAKGSLCGTSLTMPTTLTGQNGAQIKQNTKIAVTGCTKAKPKKKHTRRAHGKVKKKGGKK